MSIATYTSPLEAHPDRTGATKSGRNRLIVVHTSEGGEGPSSARNLAAFIASPGDRPSPGGGRYGAAYHYVADLDRTAIPCVPHDVVAYAAAGANHDGVHVCIPGRAGQTAEQWLDDVSAGYVETVAAVIVDVAATERIPLRRLTVAEVRDGAAGYCGHHDVSLAFGRSTHTDPGDEFPWGVLADHITRFTQEDDDMTPLARPDRVYDSRRPAAAGSLVKAGPWNPGEIRVIPLGKCTQAHVVITAVGSDPGFVSISGLDEPSETSIVNFDTDGVSNGSAPIAVPDGNLRVMCSARAHIIVDVFARG